MPSTHLTKLFKAIKANNKSNFDVSLNKYELITLLYKYGADLNLGTLSTPLCVAVARGNIDAVKTLLSCGAKPDLAQADGTTPYQMATANKHPKIAELLIAATQNTVDPNQLLHDAAVSGDLSVAETALKRGANIEAPGQTWKNTTLHRSNV